MASTIRDMDLLMRRGRREPAYVGYGWTCSGAPGYKSYCNFQGTHSHGEGNDTEWSRGQPDIAYLIPRTGQVRNTAGGPHGHPGEKDSVPKTPPAPKTVPRSNILHDMAVRAQPVMWEVERQDRKRRKFGSHSRQGDI